MNLALAKILYTTLTPTFKQYSEFSKQEIIFFSLHYTEEQLHSDWLTKAVLQISNEPEDRELIRKGALTAGTLWGNFWEGMYEYVLSN